MQHFLPLRKRTAVWLTYPETGSVNVAYNRVRHVCLLQ